MTATDTRPEAAATPAARLAPGRLRNACPPLVAPDPDPGPIPDSRRRRSTTVTPAKAGAHP